MDRTYTYASKHLRRVYAHSSLYEETLFAHLYIQNIKSILSTIARA